MRLDNREMKKAYKGVSSTKLKVLSSGPQVLSQPHQLKIRSMVEFVADERSGFSFSLSPAPAPKLRVQDQEILPLREALNLSQRESIEILSNAMISVSFANDIFNNTDHYFTNGIGIEFVHPAIRKIPLTNFLFPGTSGSEVLYGLQFTHNMYTPLNPDLQNISFGDRPFAATLSLSIYKISINHFKGSRISSGIRLGIMGPAALGSEVQSMIHDIEPEGWVHQLGNSIIADYYIQYESGFLKSRTLSLNYLAGFNIGSLHNKANAGLVLRFVNEAGKQKTQNKISAGLNYSFFLRSQINLIAYDATLQGNMFRSNSDYHLENAEISRMTFYATAGFSLNYQGINLSVEQSYLSPEFNGALPHRWLQIKTSFAL
ncbi:MAG: lipid A deacylase LpxR family protein [Bacteroidota bacterium]|nr:lipid A deacylase LpxR family protein [Bacteroidota bacterium]